MTGDVEIATSCHRHMARNASAGYPNGLEGAIRKLVCQPNLKTQALDSP